MKNILKTIPMKNILKTILLLLMALCMTTANLHAKEGEDPEGKHGIKVLVLCTGNTGRSQMAHGFLESYGKDLAVYSGGVKAEKRVNPRAVLVMRELGIDISDHTPHMVDEYIDEDWDYVITVCDNANETCPIFNGKVKHRLHMGFEDPSKAQGDYDFVMTEFRRIRDAINDQFFKLYTDMEERK